MKMLTIGTNGLAGSPSTSALATFAAGRRVETGVSGVYCWSSADGGAVNEAATRYLRLVGGLAAHEHVYGEVLFAAVDGAGVPAAVNEVALEALGWQVARSIIEAIEMRLAA